MIIADLHVHNLKLHLTTLFLPSPPPPPPLLNSLPPLLAPGMRGQMGDALQYRFTVV